MFEQATRKKYRWESKRGLLTVEDLWDLPLTGTQVNLDILAIELHSQLENESAKSFVKKDRKNTVIQDKLEILKYIIDKKMSEAEAKENELLKKQKLEKINEIIARKKDDELNNKSVEELEKMAAEIK